MMVMTSYEDDADDDGNDDTDGTMMNLIMAIIPYYLPILPSIKIHELGCTCRISLLNGLS